MNKYILKVKSFDINYIDLVNNFKAVTEFVSSSIEPNNLVNIETMGLRFPLKHSDAITVNVWC